jgi:hypothetical protein
MNNRDSDNKEESILYELNNKFPQEIQIIM